MLRRSFLASLGLAPLVARSYFDMGAAWAKHESGLIVRQSWVTWVAENGRHFPLDLPPLSFVGDQPVETRVYGNGFIDPATLEAALRRAGAYDRYLHDAADDHPVYPHDAVIVRRFAAIDRIVQPPAISAARSRSSCPRDVVKLRTVLSG